MGMSSYVMDCEDKFIDEVSARIGGCESVGELMEQLVKDKCFVNIMHMSGPEQDEFVGELWNEYWSEYANG